MQLIAKSGSVTCEVILFTVYDSVAVGKRDPSIGLFFEGRLIYHSTWKSTNHSFSFSFDVRLKSLTKF